jgi:hypothetical protein
MSIVLVIIGLIVGGVLVGQDLIKAAAIRAQISQIEKYNTAVHTFQVKYGYLPGDIPDPYATNFGFTPRGQYADEGDGNGILQDNIANSANSFYGVGLDTGEIPMFWVDLTTANGMNINFIEGSFSGASPATLPGHSFTGTALNSMTPPAKIGQGNYVYIWSNGGINYFSVAAITTIINGGGVTLAAGLTVRQAYEIDKKIDDGYPLTGSFTAQYETNNPSWSSSAQWIGPSNNSGATVGSSSTCYDNSGTAGATLQYSMAQNGGNGINCALSFKFQ